MRSVCPCIAPLGCVGLKSLCFVLPRQLNVRLHPLDVRICTPFLLRMLRTMRRSRRALSAGALVDNSESYVLVPYIPQSDVNDILARMTPKLPTGEEVSRTLPSTARPQVARRSQKSIMEEPLVIETLQIHGTRFRLTFSLSGESHELWEGSSSRGMDTERLSEEAAILPSPVQVINSFESASHLVIVSMACVAAADNDFCWSKYSRCQRAFP